MKSVRKILKSPSWVYFRQLEWPKRSPKRDEPIARPVITCTCKCESPPHPRVTKPHASAYIPPLVFDPFPPNLCLRSVVSLSNQPQSTPLNKSSQRFYKIHTFQHTFLIEQLAFVLHSDAVRQIKSEAGQVTGRNVRGGRVEVIGLRRRSRNLISP